MPHTANALWLGALASAACYSAVPLVIGAMSAVICERSGVVNLAVEGLILAGAFAGVWAGQISALAGVVTALAAGLLLGLLHWFMTQKAAMDHVLSGLAINLLAAGGTRYAAQRLFPQGIRIGGLPRGPFLILAVALVVGLGLLLSRTRFGLRARAVGEDPEAARMSGVSPQITRLYAVALGGMLGALAGAYISMADAHTFSSDMSAGKGYIALAAAIFGNWRPAGAAAGALLFGLFYAMQTQLQIAGLPLHFLGVEWNSAYLLDAAPYLLTLAALAGFVGRAVAPGALGRVEDPAAPIE